MRKDNIKIIRIIDYLLSAIFIIGLILYFYINPDFKKIYLNILLFVGGVTLIVLAYLTNKYNLNFWMQVTYFKTKKYKDISVIITLVTGMLIIIVSLIGFFFIYLS